MSMLVSWFWINFSLFLTVRTVIWFIPEDQTQRCNPLPLLREREIIILSLTQIYLDEKCIQLGLEASYQKVNTSQQLSMSPKGNSSFNDGSVGPLSCCFVWVFSTLWWPIVGPACCLSKVCFHSKKKPAAACAVFCSSYPKQPSDSKLTL